MSRIYTDLEKSRLTGEVVALVSTMPTAKACAKVGVPESTFLGWMTKNVIDAESYTRARTLYIETIASEIMTISDEDIPKDAYDRSDNAAVQRNRLRVDSRKWLLSKLAPKKYGDKLTLSGDNDSPVIITKIERTIIDKRTANDEDGSAIDDEG